MQRNTAATLLRSRLTTAPEAAAYVWLDADAAVRHTWSCRELHLRAGGVAQALAERGAKSGDRALVFGSGLEVIAAMYGSFYTGVAVVPAPPPTAGRAVERLRHIVAHCRPRFVLTTTELHATLATSFPELEWIAVDALRAEREPVPLAPEATAVIQYTSGSTSAPKGVVVSHANLVANCASLAATQVPDTQSRHLSWLPYYHDMGLIDGILEPMFAEHPGYLMAPETFIQQPLAWLRAIDRHRITLSGAPNFAYGLCARRALSRPDERFDLSTWEAAYSGGELVRAETMLRFAEVFATHGFRAASLRPGYGLAEATYYVTAVPHRRPLRVERGIVSMGPPGEGTSVRVVDGEIWVSGPSVSSGYFEDPEATRETFVDGWVRTGDQGFILDGEVYVTGRTKDLIIVRGRNLHPQDVEAATEQVDSRVRPGGTVAIGIDGDETEALVIVAEVEPAPAETLRQLASAIHSRITQDFDVAPHDVVFVPPGRALKTTSGKLRRRETAARYREESLASHWTWLRTKREAPPIASASGVLAELQARFGADVDLDAPLEVLGLDSLDRVELLDHIEQKHALRAPDVLSVRTLRELLAALQPIATTVQRGEPATLRPTVGQRAIYFWNAVHPGTRALHFVWALRVTPALKEDEVQEALRVVVARHPALRFCFADDTAKLIAPERIRLERGEDVNAWLDEPFDLDEGPLFALGAFPDGVLAFRAHHAIMDLRSAQVVTKELFAVLAGQALATHVDWTFAGAAAAEQRALAGDAWTTHRQALREALDGLATELELPRDTGAARDDRQLAHTVRITLDKAAVERLRVLAAGNATTMFAWIFAAWTAWLARLSARSTFAVGVSALGRSGPEEQSAVGFFTNLFAVPVNVDPGAGFDAHARRMHEALRTFGEHAEVPFELVLQDVAAPRIDKRRALIDAVIHHRRLGGDVSVGYADIAAALPNHVVQALPLDPLGSQFDHELYVEEHGHERVDLLCCFRRDVFTEKAATAWSEGLRALFSAVATAPASALGLATIARTPTTIAAGPRPSAVSWPAPTRSEWLRERGVHAGHRVCFATSDPDEAVQTLVSLWQLGASGLHVASDAPSTWQKALCARHEITHLLRGEELQSISTRNATPIATPARLLVSAPRPDDSLAARLYDDAALRHDVGHLAALLGGTVYLALSPSSPRWILACLASCDRPRLDEDDGRATIVADEPSADPSRTVSFAQDGAAHTIVDSPRFGVVLVDGRAVAKERVTLGDDVGASVLPGARGRLFLHGNEGVRIALDLDARCDDAQHARDVRSALARCNGRDFSPRAIVTVALGHPLIADADLVVGTGPRGEGRTVLYVTPRDLSNPPRPSDVGRYVLARTAVSIDSVIVVQALVRDSRGALRTGSLPPPPWLPPREFPYEPPASPTEEALVELWADALGRSAEQKPIGRRDNFFDLGGDSLLIVHVCQKAKSRGLPLEPLLFFRHPVVAELAAAMAERSHG